MAQSIIQIKRSVGASVPSLRPGELAYSANTEGDKRGILYIGSPEVGPDGLATTVYQIGGKKYTELLDTTAGTVQTGKAIVVDQAGKVDHVKSDKITVPQISADDTNKIIIGDADKPGQKVVIHDPYVKTDQGEQPLTDYVTNIVQGGVINVNAGEGIADITNENGTFTIALSVTGVTANTYGSATEIPVLTINKFGQVTAASTAEISTKLKVNQQSVDLLSGEITTNDGITTASSSEGSVNISLDETVVRTTKEQTITGKKTFAQAPFINDEQIATKNFVTSEINNQATDSQSAAKAYTDEQIPLKITQAVGTEVQAHSDQLDKLAAHTEEGIVYRTAAGEFQGYDVVNKDTTVTVEKAASEKKIKIGLPTVGTSGTYFKVTTDDQGRVTAGENPTTVDQFGITDAVHKTGDTVTGVIKYAENISEDDFDENTLITKRYADNVALGFVHHAACQTGSTENIDGQYAAATTLTSYQGIGATFTLADNSGNATVIGGVTLTQGMRVLLVGQTDAKQNGAYKVTTVPEGATGNIVMTRVEDFDGQPTIEYRGASFLVADGDLKGSVWRLNNEGVITFGQDDITFVHVFTPSTYVGGDGINVNELTISIAQGNTVKAINGKVEVASGQSNQGKVLVAGTDGTAASWKELTVSDIKTGIITPENGGTGSANSTALTWVGGPLNINMSGQTNITLPTTGTLATITGTETLSNKTIEAVSITVSDTTETTNASTGAVQVAGGVGVTKSVYVGQDIIGSNTSKLDGFVIDGGVY